MRSWSSSAVVCLVLAGSLAGAPAADKPLPDAIAAPGQTLVLTAHAEGAQIYECKADAKGNLAWVFREPIATRFGTGRPSAVTLPARNGNSRTAVR